MLSDVRQRVHALDHAIHRERGESQRLLADVKDELRKAKLERTVAEGQIAPLRESRDTWQALAVDRANTIAELQAQLTQVRNRMSVASSAPAEPISEPEKARETDDTATRFSLLELD